MGDPRSLPSSPRTRRWPAHSPWIPTDHVNKAGSCTTGREVTTVWKGKARTIGGSNIRFQVDLTGNKLWSISSFFHNGSKNCPKNQLNEYFSWNHNVSIAATIIYTENCPIIELLCIYTFACFKAEWCLFLYFCLQRHRDHSTLRGVLPKWVLCVFCRRFAMATQAEQSIRGRLQHKVWSLCHTVYSKKYSPQ